MIKFDGYGENAVTMKIKENETINTGAPVSLNEDGTVSAGAEGAEVFGFCLYARDGIATVQTSGCVNVSVPSELKCGIYTLVCDGSGGLKSSDTGKRLFALVKNGSQGGDVITF